MKGRKIIDDQDWVFAGNMLKDIRNDLFFLENMFTGKLAKKTKAMKLFPITIRILDKLRSELENEMFKRIGNKEICDDKNFMIFYGPTRNVVPIRFKDTFVPNFSIDMKSQFKVKEPQFKVKN